MQARFISEYDALIRVSALLCIFSIIISWPSSGPRESRDFDPRESRGTGRKKIILWDIWDHMVNPGWIWCLMLFVIRDVLDNTRKYLIIVSGYYKITWSILNKSESKNQNLEELLHCNLQLPGTVISKKCSHIQYIKQLIIKRQLSIHFYPQFNSCVVF